MNTEAKSWLSVIVTSVILTLYWSFSLTISNQLSQYILAGFSVFLLISTFQGKVQKLVGSDFQIHLFRATTTLVLLFFSWNWVFRYMSNHTTFVGNIFRGAFYNFQSPTYFHLGSSNIGFLVPLILATLAFFWFIRKQHNKLDQSFRPIVFWPLATLIVLAYSWRKWSITKTFLSANCHYSSFAIDLDKFSSPSDLLQNFVGKMGSLYVHNNHYPPGVLFILKVGEYHFPYLLKTLVFLATILSTVALGKLMDFYKCSTTAKNICKLVFLSSGAILYFPEIAIDPLSLPLAILGMYFLLKALYAGSYKFSLLFALVIAAYIALTFSALFFLAIAGLYVLLLLVFKQVKFLKSVAVAITTVVGVVAIYLIVYQVFSFNMLSCFLEALANEKKQMSYNTLDSWSTYLIISSGNAIAYIVALGIPIFGVVTYGMVKLRKAMPKPLLILGYSLLLAIPILAFSSHFFLEVERIWIFITPFLIILSGFFMAELYKTNQRKFVIGMLVLSALLTFILRVGLNNCY